jgi:hypothetical protein
MMSAKSRWIAPCYCLLLFTSLAGATEVSVYPEFESEIGRFVVTRGLQVHPVDPVRKAQVLRSTLEFAASLGLSGSGVDPGKKGSQSQVRRNLQGEVSHLYYLEQADQPDSDEEVVVVREAWGTEHASPVAPAAKGVQQRVGPVESFLQQNSWLPLSSGEQRVRVHDVEAREAREDGASRVVLKSHGHIRMLAGRQVFNSALKLETRPGGGRVSGLVLSNWWPLLGASRASLKSGSQLVSDIKRTFGAASQLHGLKLTHCELGFYQLPEQVIPAVSCQGVEKHIEGDAHLKVVVSMVVGKETADEILARSDWDGPQPLEGEGTGSRESGLIWPQFFLPKALASDGEEDFVSASCMPRGHGDEGSKTFSLYFSNEESRFRHGIKEFHRKFGLWSGERQEAQSEQFYGTGTSSYYADEADLVILAGHGTPRKVMLGEGAGTLRLNHASRPTACLGSSDMEYLIHSGCHGGSAVVCEGLSALARYKGSESRHTIFKGLHLMASNHGSRLSGSHHAKKISRKLARYLEDGLSVREAWADAENDSNGYSRNSRSCYKIRNPERGCALKSFECDRWDSYPGIVYIEEHRGESLSNRERHRSDPVPGDANYRLEHLYFFDSDNPRVPIHAPGYDLP